MAESGDKAGGTTNGLPSLEALFGGHTHRLRGIGGWDAVPQLGQGNLERLLERAQENVNALLTADAPRAELRALRGGVVFLGECLAEAKRKPLLPRLRVESFRKGEAVYVYAGDGEGATARTDWVRAEITDVSKSYRADWNDGSPNGGWFWQLTATASEDIFPKQRSLAFSTTEPRAIPVWEWEYLRRAPEEDPLFLHVYCANAWREWCPLWCLERGAGCAGASMDMAAWLKAGSVSPGQR